MAQPQQGKRQRLQAEPIMVKTIMAKEFFRPASSNLMLVWGVPKSKTSKALDWTTCTTKATYRTLVVKFKCHRPKCPTVDINVMYREDFPREGRQLRVGEEEVGMFIVTDLLARLKERNMLQLGNKVIIWPVEGSPNTFRTEIAPSICPYCEHPMESGEFVECEGCDAHAHKQCVPTIWAEDEGQKTAGAGYQPFKFACPSCEAREPAISYSETCTMQTTNQNGHAGLRAGINPLKRPMPGMDAPLPPVPPQQQPQQQQQQQQQDGAGPPRPSPSQPPPPSAAAAAAARREGGPAAPAGPHTTPPPPRPQPPGAAAQGQQAGTPPVSALRALGNNSSSSPAAPGAKAAAAGQTPPPHTLPSSASAAQQQRQQQQQQQARRRGDGASEGATPSASGRRPGSLDSPTPNDAATPARAGRLGQQQQPSSLGAGGASSAKHRAQAQPPGPPPQPSPASQQQHTPPLAGRGPTPSVAGTPRTDGPAARTPGSADSVRMKGSEGQRSTAIIARMAKMRQDLDENKAEIEGLQEEMEEAKQALAASKAAHASLEAAHTPLLAENAELKEQVAALKAGGSSQAEAEAARKEAAAARASASEASSRAQELEKQLQQVQSQLEQQSKETRAAEERRAAAQAALKQAEAALNLERATSAGQAADLEAYKQRCAELDAELKALEEATMDGME